MTLWVRGINASLASSDPRRPEAISKSLRATITFLSIIDIFSKRKKAAEASGQLDVYQYDNLPDAFRVQVIHIWRGAIGAYRPFDPIRIQGPSPWEKVSDALSREYGKFQLVDSHDDASIQCQKFLLTASTDEALDIIEMVARVIDRYMRSIHPDELAAQEITQNAGDALEELNGRFREHAIGYQYEGGRLVRVDSEYVHAEIVRPALILLADEGFKGASQEFLSAHSHFREKRYKEAVADALKAFESTMKTICAKKGWKVQPTAQAKDLVAVMVERELIPSYLLSHFTGLRSTLESGVPTVRNRTSSHGQGEEEHPVPEYIAAYAIHLTATNLLLLVRAYQARR
jgi:hypothetical protein